MRRFVRLLVLGQLLALIQVLDVGLGSGAAAAAVADLPLPGYDPAAVANPSATVSAGTTRMGGIPGTFTVSDTGAAQYKIPLQVVPGRGGFTPDLALEYSSDTGDGPVGVGFVLPGQSSITRCAKTVADDGVAEGVRLDESDRFCLDGRKLVAVSGAYGADGTEYGTKPDTHVRVRSHKHPSASALGPSHFTVWTPDGRVQDFYDATQIRQGSGYVNIAWQVTAARDTAGNTISYRYGRRTVSASDASEVERWLESISYGRGTTLDRKVEFGYEPRPDHGVAWLYGSKRESTQRLVSITMSADAGGWKRARGYTLSYDSGGPTKASKLARLTECGTVATECKQPTVFSWWYGSEGFKPGQSQTSTNGQPLVPSTDESQILSADFNGDGRTDLVWPEGQNPPGTEARVWKHLNANANGAYTTVHNGEFNGYNRAATAYAFDYDNDGMVDLMPREAQLSPYRPILSRPGNVHRRAETPFFGGFNQVWTATNHSAGAMMGDFDGDGYQDVLEFNDPAPGNGSDSDYEWRWRRRTGVLNPAIDNTGPYGQPTQAFDDKAFEAPRPLSYSFPPTKVVVADINGDGRDEIVYQFGEFAAYWDFARGASFMVDGLSGAMFRVDTKLIDVNGDGLVDVLRDGDTTNDKGRLFYQLNTGRGFLATTGTAINFKPGSLSTAEIIDYDGDGSQDLLLPRFNGTAFVGMDVVRLTVGAGGALSFQRTQTVIDFAPRDLESLRRQGPRVVDADGDGLDDVVLVDRPASGTPALRLWRHNGGVSSGVDYGRKPDLLYQVFEGNQIPQGALGEWPTVQVTYAPLADPAVHQRDNCPRTAHVNCLAAGMYVVQQVRMDAGLNDNPGAHFLSDYVYRTGRVDKKARTFLGFAEKRVTTRSSVVGLGQSVSRTFYSNTVPGRDPRPIEVWKTNQLPGGQLALRRANLTWAEKATAGGSYFPYVGTTERRDYEFPAPACGFLCSPQTIDGYTPHRRAVETLSNMDAYGNAGTVVTDVSGNAFSRLQVATNYDIDVTNWLVRRPKTVATTYYRVHLSNGKTRSVDYTYVAGTTLVSQEKRYATVNSPGQVLTVDYQYDAGNPVRVKATDMQTGEVRQATASYDPYGYPHAAMNALGHVTRRGYDPITGQLKVAVDANGLRGDLTYDTLGRLVKSRVPTGAETVISYALELRGSEYLIRTQTSDGTGAVSQVLGDRLGRPVVERFKGFDGAMRERESRYDPHGRLASRTLFGTTDRISYSYDDLGRVVRQQNPDGGVSTWAYQGFTTTYTDPGGDRKQSTVDPLGETIQVVDGLGTPAETRRRYEYDPFGTLNNTKVDGVDASLSRFTYDAFGNMLSSVEAETGTTTNTYNAFGELITTTDAIGRRAALTYDALGRVTDRSVTQNGSARSQTQYIYDTGSKGKPARAGMRDERGVWTYLDYGYDALSRLKTLDYRLAEESFRVTHDHDVHNRVTAVRYPKLPGQSAGTKVGYEYGGNGSLATAKVIEPASEAATLWTAKATDAQDRLVQEESGDGVKTSRLYNWRGSTLDLQVSTSATDASPNRRLFDEHYGYDFEGNLNFRSAGLSGQVEAFTHDALDRVTAVQLSYPDPCPDGTCRVRPGPEWGSGSTEADPGDPVPPISYQSDSWAYDKLGNITSSARRGTFAYDPARPTLVTGVTGGIFGNRSYAYDAAGNQIGRPDGQVTYNDFDLPTQITPATGRPTTFQYYPTGERARKSDSASVTTYVPGYYERHVSGGATEHRLLVPAGGGIVATLIYHERAESPIAAKQPTRYVHGDRLGSTNLVTVNEATSGYRAVAKETRSYDAFGKVRNPDLSIGDAGYTQGIQPPLADQGYTGHEDDRELGLVDMGGRIYDPTLGRFLTPDPNVDGPNATQAWNRYSYVGNNPLRHTDPNGFQYCSGCEEFLEQSQSFDDFGEGGSWVYNTQINSLDRQEQKFRERYRQDSIDIEYRRTEKNWMEAKSGTNGIEKAAAGDASRNGATGGLLIEHSTTHSEELVCDPGTGSCYQVEATNIKVEQVLDDFGQIVDLSRLGEPVGGEAGAGAGGAGGFGGADGAGGRADTVTDGTDGTGGGGSTDPYTSPGGYLFFGVGSPTPELPWFGGKTLRFGPSISATVMVGMSPSGHWFAAQERTVSFSAGPFTWGEKIVSWSTDGGFGFPMSPTSPRVRAGNVSVGFGERETSVRVHKGPLFGGAGVYAPLY